MWTLISLIDATYVLLSIITALANGMGISEVCEVADEWKNEEQTASSQVVKGGNEGQESIDQADGEKGRKGCQCTNIDEFWPPFVCVGDSVWVILWAVLWAILAVLGTDERTHVIDSRAAKFSCHRRIFFFSRLHLASSSLASPSSLPLSLPSPSLSPASSK